MKKASMVLGIVGGSISLLIGIIYIIVGCAFLTSFSGHGYSGGAEAGGGIFLAFGIAFACGGGLGLAGGITLNKHNTASGVMMIVGGVIGIFNIITILGGIFALIPEKQPYPPYPYPPYMPQNPQYLNQQPYAPQNPYPGQQPYAPQNPYSGQPPYMPQNPPYPGQPPYAPQNPQYPGQPQDQSQDKPKQ